MVVGEIKSSTLRLEEEMKLSNQRLQDKLMNASNKVKPSWNKIPHLK